MEKADVVVFSSLNLAEVHLIRGTLTREGIPSRIKSSMLAPLAGEVPMDDARTELYVAASLVEKALEIIRSAQALEGPDRPCPQCGEMNPISFELCWNCGADLES